jgi:hypothetical protein
MAFQPLVSDVYQMGEEHQLGVFKEIYTRSVTLSGKIAFTGILLLGFFLVIDVILLIGWESAASFMESPLGFAQGIFLVGSLLSMIRHEHMTTPLHPKLSVTLYADGLLYCKGRTTQVVRWEEIQSIERQFKVYRRKGNITDVRPAYTCELLQKPNLVLSAEITGVAEVGTIIERELTKRFLPSILSDYRAGKSITFSQLTLTQQYIGNRKKDMGWTRVSKVEVGPEQLVAERAEAKTDTLTAPLSNVPNVCLLEGLLEDISQEKGFELCLVSTTETRDAEVEKMPSELKRKR